MVAEEETFAYTRFKLNGLLFAGTQGAVEEKVEEKEEEKKEEAIAIKVETEEERKGGAGKGGSWASAKQSGVFEQPAEIQTTRVKEKKKKEKKEKRKSGSKLGEKKEEKKEKRKSGLGSMLGGKEKDKGNKTPEREAASGSAIQRMGTVLDEKKQITVWYGDNLFKIIAIEPSSTAVQVCEKGAKKLGLESFTFGLYVLCSSSPLPRLLQASEKPYDIVCAREKEVKGGVLGLTFMFMSKPKITNLGIRMKAYIGWINHVISKKCQIRIKDKAEFQDGVVFCHLAEALTGKLCIKFYANPKNKKQRRENLNSAFDLLTKKLPAVDKTLVPELMTGSDEALHTVLWQIFFGEMGSLMGGAFDELSFFETLFAWVKKSLAPYSPQIIVTDLNFTFHNGQAFCALIESHDAYALNVKEKVTNMDVENLATAFRIARKVYAIPMLLFPEDFTKYPKNYDELSIIMYLVMCYCQFKLKDKKNEELRKKAVISVSDGGKKACIRLFFEGFKDIESLTLSLEEGQTALDVKKMIATKKHVDRDSLRVFEKISGEEKAVPEAQKISLQSAADPALNYQIIIRQRRKKPRQTKNRPLSMCGGNNSSQSAPLDQSIDSLDLGEITPRGKKETGGGRSATERRGVGATGSESDVGARKIYTSRTMGGSGSGVAGGGSSGGISAAKAQALREAMLSAQSSTTVSPHSSPKMSPGMHNRSYAR